jgi:hypothetical protein
MIQNLSLRAKRSVAKQSKTLAIASFRFAPFAMTIGHFFTWSTPKEARETKYWLRLLKQSKMVDVDVTQAINSVNELIRILTSIVKTTSENL